MLLFVGILERRHLYMQSTYFFKLERPSSHEPVLNREVNSYSIEMSGYTMYSQ